MGEVCASVDSFAKRKNDIWIQKRLSISVFTSV